MTKSMNSMTATKSAAADTTQGEGYKMKMDDIDAEEAGAEEDMFANQTKIESLKIADALTENEIKFKFSPKDPMVATVLSTRKIFWGGNDSLSAYGSTNRVSFIGATAGYMARQEVWAPTRTEEGRKTRGTCREILFRT